MLASRSSVSVMQTTLWLMALMVAIVLPDRGYSSSLKEEVSSIYRMLSTPPPLVEHEIKTNKSDPVEVRRLRNNKLFNKKGPAGSKSRRRSSPQRLRSDEGDNVRVPDEDYPMLDETTFLPTNDYFQPPGYLTPGIFDYPDDRISTISYDDLPPPIEGSRPDTDPFESNKNTAVIIPTVEPSKLAPPEVASRPNYPRVDWARVKVVHEPKTKVDAELLRGLREFSKTGTIRPWRRNDRFMSGDLGDERKLV